jgi:hypothetical protein
MLSASSTAPVLPDVIRESLAGLACNIAASRQAPIDRELGEVVVGHALARLDGRETALLLSGHHKAITRAAEEIASLFAEADAYDEAFGRKLQAGQPLDLADVVKDAIKSISTRRGGKRPVKFFATLEIDKLSRKVVQDQSCGRCVEKAVTGETTTVHYKGTLLHRDPMEGPALSVTRPDGEPVRAMYFRDGVLHRPPAEGPAVIVRDAEGRVIYEGYFEEGKFHRDPPLGPALHLIGPEFEKTGYYLGGKPHRDHRDGPAAITRFPDGAVKLEYLTHGATDRPSEEGPAFQRMGPSGEIIHEAWLENGKLHRDPKSGPACRTLLAEEGRERLEYFVDGLAHRDEADGPAWIATSLRTGRIVEEGYYRRGECHRQGGPATIIRNDDGGLLFEAWFEHGKLHRDPAKGPAVICRDEDGHISTAEFWQDGVLLEDAADGEVSPC